MTHRSLTQTLRDREDGFDNGAGGGDNYDDPNQDRLDKQTDLDDLDDQGEGDEDEDEDEEDDEKEHARIERIARAVASGMSVRQPSDHRQPQQQQPLDPQRVKELLNVYEVDETTLRAMGFEEVKPDQLKAFNQFVKGIIKNSTSISNVLVQQLQAQINQRLGELDQFVQRTVQDNARNKFFETYPQLKKYESIVSAVANNLAENDPEWANLSFERGAKKVAKEVRRLLKQSGIEISRQTQSDGEANLGAEPESRVNGAPRMPRLAGSGRSSTTGQRGKAMSVDEEVYGPGNVNW